MRKSFSAPWWLHIMWLFQFNAILMQKYFLLDNLILCFRDPGSVSTECEFPAHPIKYRCNCLTEFTTETLEETEIVNSGDAKLVLTEVNNDWRQSTSKWKQPLNDFVMGRCSSNPTQDYFYPVKKAKLKAVRKDVVLSFRMDHDFFARMALLGQFHHIEIKATFTLKTTLMVRELFLDLLPILRDSRERQTKPDSPNSLSDASQPP